jgi:endonuclease/exonuclease/phosphatase family metal-dependent hydrolase
MKLTAFFVLVTVNCLALADRLPGQENLPARPKACRSVHLAFPADEGTAFYNELTITESSPGTYFMACGSSKGYFGIQELVNGKKIVLFSVWEPGRQNNPNLAPEDRRVKEIAAGKNVRVKRFGGEGTGGQSFFDYNWELGQICRFVVYAKPDGDRTRYAAYFYVPQENRWQHMATFSTLADRHLLRGYYSFIEDFLRNGTSAKQSRHCHVGNGWVLIDDHWQSLTKASFTADRTPTDNIDAGSSHQRFFLATGGDTKNEHTKLRKTMSIPDAQRKPPLDLPEPFGDGSVKGNRLRILSYNIKHGRGNDNQVDLERTASVIRRLSPDIVALQEVDTNVKRSGSVDEPEVLSKLTGLDHHAFGSFFDYQGGEYGMAILSKYPISNSDNLRLPRGAEPRTSLVAKIALSPTDSLTIADVHFYRTEAERLAQAQTLLDQLEKTTGEIVIVGDFNSTPGSAVMNLFQPDWKIPDKGEDHFTFSSDRPVREIDFAMTQKNSKWTILNIDVVDEPVASDHRPLVLELRKN